MGAIARAEIGKTGLMVSRLGFGGVPLGGLYQDVSEADAGDTIRRALELGINYFDTAPIYGLGKGEIRLGRELASVPRDSIVVATKVGYSLASGNGTNEREVFHRFVNVPPLRPFYDYSYDGIMRSLEGSLHRLNLASVDILNIHDPDHSWEEAMSTAYPTIHRLRSEGVVRAIGVGMNQAEMLARFAREGDFDCLLLAGRYTLMDHSGLSELLPICERKGISVIIGGPYNSGILATGARFGATYNYVEAPPALLEKVAAIEAVCDRHQVPLPAAALQFPMAHPAVTAVIPGARSSAEVAQNSSFFTHLIPAGFWQELRHLGLLPPDAPVPSGS
ncbi:MAG TPA: aldo/keto reductase [Acidobacteriaceae bacterium]|nr:aldo/keto reductase [Acidobacteriaceae bacterium]